MGVVKDFHAASLLNKIAPILFNLSDERGAVFSFGEDRLFAQA
jgi:hypothetical protein